MPDQHTISKSNIDLRVWFHSLLSSSLAITWFIEYICGVDTPEAIGIIEYICGVLAPDKNLIYRRYLGCIDTPDTNWIIEYNCGVLAPDTSWFIE